MNVGNGEAQKNAVARSTGLCRGHARRPGHPVTSDLPYTRDEVEFMTAMHSYGLRSGHKFPAWSEILGVLRSLGYARPAVAGDERTK